jgi:hypothetical protein
MRGAGLVVLFAIGCARADRIEPAAHPIVGPDGSAMLHVSCGHDEARCYELAGRSCPAGYDLALTPRHNLLVRCLRHSPSARTAVWSSAGGGSTESLAPSPYAIQETVQPWPSEPLAPSPYPPLAPGRTGPSPEPPRAPPRDLGF